MPTRQTKLTEWLTRVLSHSNFTITPLAGDASFRRYFRLHQDGQTRVVMDAPPEKEGLTSFLHVAELLEKQGVYTPAIDAVDYAQGFVLLEDLGDDLFLNRVSKHNADTLYTFAMQTLLTIQKTPTTSLPVFDQIFMLTELNLFREWFLDAFLAISLTKQENSIIHHAFDWLMTQISQQPLVFIHRDYHSRNLIVAGNKLGVIDFQDAMQGPIAYDLVSLLKDCYIQWPHEDIMHWLVYFHAHLPKETHLSFAEFNRAFDLCGLQRHFKILGVFCRLHIRDKKSAYLRDLPLTFHYTMACLERYDELQAFYHLMQEKVQPIFLKACHL